MECGLVDADGVICDEPAVPPGPLCTDHREDYIEYLTFCHKTHQKPMRPWDFRVWRVTKRGRRNVWQ